MHNSNSETLSNGRTHDSKHVSWTDQRLTQTETFTVVTSLSKHMYTCLTTILLTLEMTYDYLSAPVDLTTTCQCYPVNIQQVRV